MDPETCPRKVDKTNVAGSNPRDRPKKTWLECIRNDLKVKVLEASLAQNSIAWCLALNPKSRCGLGNEVAQPSDTGKNARLGVSK